MRSAGPPAPLGERVPDPIDMQRAMCPRSIPALNPMISGNFPLRDWNGEGFEPLSPEDLEAGHHIAGGLLFVPWQFRGDMDYFTNYLGLNHYQSLFPCPWCEANAFDEDTDRCAELGATPTPWNDWRVDARWVHLVVVMANLHICCSIPKADISSKSSCSNNSKLLQVMKVQQMFQNRQLSQLPHLRLVKDHKVMLHENKRLWHRKSIS